MNTKVVEMTPEIKALLDSAVESMWDSCLSSCTSRTCGCYQRIQKIKEVFGLDDEQR